MKACEVIPLAAAASVSVIASDWGRVEEPGLESLLEAPSGDGCGSPTLDDVEFIRLYPPAGDPAYDEDPPIWL